ncbi:hypothetical protein HRbin11_02104 [bacterium HR11]|nr:hypothetical protein HRbin11_02104 [bacterium HR11]
MRLGLQVKLSPRVQASAAVRPAVIPQAVRLTLRAFTSRLIGPVTHFFEYVALYSPLGVRVRPPSGWPCFIEGDVPDVEPEGLVQTCRQRLAELPPGDETLFALELLPFLTPEGFLREDDATLARQTGIPLPEVARARRRLQATCGVGWLHMFDYLADRTGSPDLAGLAGRITAVLQTVPDAATQEEKVLAALLDWLDHRPDRRALLQTALRQHGTRPVAPVPSASIAVPRFIVPDVLLVEVGDTLEPVVYTPGLHTPGGQETATILLTEAGFRDPTAPVRHYQVMVQLRKRLLTEACRAALTANGPFLRGQTGLRRLAAFRPPRRHHAVLHALCLLPDQTIEPLWYLLGWDYLPNRRRLVPLPLREIRQELRVLLQLNPSMSLQQIRDFLREQFSVTVSVATVSRLRKSIRTE